MRNITLRWFLAVGVLLFMFVGCFVMFQFNREQSYNKTLLDTRLQSVNERVYDLIEQRGGVPAPEEIDKSLLHYREPDLRLTLIATDGRVLYDAGKAGLESYQNHLGRAEVRQALTSGRGYDIRRSATTHRDLFYSATFHRGAGIIVRSALPFDVSLMKHLINNQHYFWLAAVITIALMMIFYVVIRKMRLTITEKENLLAHLRISREGLGVFDSERHLVQANNLFSQYANLISDEYLQMTEDIINVHEMQSIRIFLNREAIRQRDSSQAEPYTSLTIHKNGRTLIVNCVLFQDDGFEISINDVTQAEEQARLKKQLTENIAHELKTPVSSINGYLETMMNSGESLPPERLHHFIERCYAQSLRLLHLVDDISTLNRLSAAAEQSAETADKTAVHATATDEADIAAIVRNVVQDTAGEMEQQSMSIDCQLPPSMPIHGDPSTIYSIFRNLTDNAIAYAGSGSKITLRMLRQDSDYYYFSFADNGAGVDEEHLPRLFDRFYRVDKGRSRKLGGTGLGLAIVKNAISLYGGSITAKRCQPHGLEFLFTLRH